MTSSWEEVERRVLANQKADGASGNASPTGRLNRGRLNAQSLVPGQERLVERAMSGRGFLVCLDCLFSPDLKGWDLDSHPKSIAGMLEHRLKVHGIAKP